MGILNSSILADRDGWFAFHITRFLQAKDCLLSNGHRRDANVLACEGIYGKDT